MSERDIFITILFTFISIIGMLVACAAIIGLVSFWGRKSIDEIKRDYPTAYKRDYSGRRGLKR